MIVTEPNLQERRRHARRGFERFLIGTCVDPQGRTQLIRMQGMDISASGMGAVSSRMHGVGDMLVLRLTLGGRKELVSCRVVRSRPCRGGVLVGLAFQEFSPFGEQRLSSDHTAAA